MGNQASPLAIRTGRHVQLTLSRRLLRARHSRASHLKRRCRLSWCIGFLAGGQRPLSWSTKCNILFTNPFSLRKMKAVQTGIFWGVKNRLPSESGISEPEVVFLLGVGYHCSLSLEIPKRDKVHQVITPPLSLPHSRHSLSVSALVLGSLGCSGLTGKLLHQTRVSSAGCLTVWLLQSCPAILQKPRSQPLWRALMKSMAWAPLLLILRVRSHTWLSKRQVESQIRRRRGQGGERQWWCKPKG